MMIAKVCSMFVAFFVYVNLVSPNSALPSSGPARNANINEIALFETDLSKEPAAQDDENIVATLRKRGLGDLFGSIGNLADGNVSIHNSGIMKGNGNGSIYLGGNNFGPFSSKRRTSPQRNVEVNNTGEFTGNYNGSVFEGGWDSSSPKRTPSRSGQESPRLQRSPSKGSVSPNGLTRSTSNVGRNARINNNWKSAKGKGNGQVYSLPQNVPLSSVFTNSINWSGQYMTYDEDGLYFTVVSPRNLNIQVHDRAVYVNEKCVCGDIRRLDQEAHHQIRKDGSAWHTNLSLGREMTAKEKRAFETKVQRLEAERQEAKEAVRQAKEEAKRAREAAKKVREAARERRMRQRPSTMDWNANDAYWDRFERDMESMGEKLEASGRKREAAVERKEAAMERRVAARRGWEV